ncbi:MAG: hypothetical protein KBE41_11095 [Lutibacter sp.]|nr:hypothetical protein [Lutibacter sp.]
MKNILYLFTFIITVTAIAQTSSSVDIEKMKMKQALSYGDKSVAVSSMYSIIAMEGPKSVYKDSLAYLYFNERNFVSCFLVTKDILVDKPADVALLEMNTISLESIGALEKALEGYKTLLAKTNTNYQAYKVAGLEYQLDKLEDAYATIKKASTLTHKENVKVTFQVNKNFNQSVDLKPAIIYLQGLIELDLKKNKEAKASLEQAVALFPEFALAKSKLLTLETEQK